MSLQISPVSRGRDRAEVKDSTDLADVKLLSPACSSGSLPPPTCSAQRLSQHCNETADDVHDAVRLGAIEEPSFPLGARRQSAVKAELEASLAGLLAGPVSRCRQLGAPSSCPPWARAGAQSRRRARGLSFLHQGRHYGRHLSYLHLSRPGHWRAAAGRFWGTAPAAWAACAYCASPAAKDEIFRRAVALIACILLYKARYDARDQIMHGRT